MSSSDKKNKRNGIIGTISFHILVFFSFLFLGLTYQDPPPAEEGISINFGFVDEGAGEIEPESEEKTIEIIEDEIIEEQIASTEEIITQNIIETSTVEKTEKKKVEVPKENPKEEIIEEKKPEVNIKALYPGKKESSETSEGENNYKGNQGIIEGDSDAILHEGSGIGENGTAYQLGGRNVEFKPKPIYKIQVEGKVVVIITVDQLGNVINAIPGAKGSTTLNKELLRN